MLQRLGVLLLGGCLLAQPLQAADDASAGLKASLSGIDSLSGNFRQELRSGEGALLETSSGDFRLLKPGYFAWHIRDPDEQLLLAAGSDLWHYDVELETATRRDIPDDAASPLAILGGDVERLTEQYQVTSPGEDQYRLVPRREQADFTVIDLYFESGVPIRMQLNDPLGRLTVIAFSSLQQNPPLTAEDFQFVPPPGIDVYDNE